MKTAILSTLIFLGTISAQAHTLLCSTDQLAWTQLKVSGVGSASLSIEILNTVPAHMNDIGAVANLEYVQTVEPNGRKFFNYKGKFIGGHPQKYWSIYLSEDNRTLTVFGSGHPYNYVCE